MTSSPTPAVLPEARALIEKIAKGDVLAAFDWQREARNIIATPPASDAAVPAGGKPACPCCGFTDISFERTCHNSGCTSYAQPETVYEGWKDAAAPKVASDTGAGLREALKRAAIDLLHTPRSNNGGRADRHIEESRNRIRDVLYATPTDATDGATGGGEAFDMVYNGGYAAGALASAPGGDLLEQAARVADNLASVAERGKQHLHPLPCDTNEAWRRVEDACRDIADAIRALSARNQTDDGGEK